MRSAIFTAQEAASSTQLHLMNLLALFHSDAIGQTNHMAKPDDVANEIHITYPEALKFTGQGQGHIILLYR